MIAAAARLSEPEIAAAAAATLAWIRGQGKAEFSRYRARGATPSQAAGLAVRRATQYETAEEISEIVAAVLKAEWQRRTHVWLAQVLVRLPRLGGHGGEAGAANALRLRPETLPLLGEGLEEEVKKNGFLAKIGIFAAFASMFHAKAKFGDREKAVAQSGRTRGGRTRRATKARGSGGTGALVYDRKRDAMRATKSRAGFKLARKLGRARSNQGWMHTTVRMRQKMRKYIARGYGYVAPPVKKATTATA